MDQFDFSKLEVTQQTIWVELPEVAPKARVCVRTATEANPHYFNAMMKRSGMRARRMVRTDRISIEDAQQNRSEDRELFPRYVLVNWDGITDKAGKPVPFAEDAVREFCAKLPDWLFDRVRNAAATPERFLPEGEDVPDAGKIAGN
jgi:hypothetical protein